MHTASKGRNGVAHPSYSNNHLRVKYPLCFIISYVKPVTEQYKQELFEKHLRNQSSHYADNFHYTKEAITWYHQINTFHCH